MTGRPELSIQLGCWRIYTAVDTVDVHPALLAVLYRDGYATKRPSGRVKLTVKGRDVVDDLIYHFTGARAPLPPARGENPTTDS